MSAWGRDAQRYRAKRLRLARVVRERLEGDFTFTSLTRIAHEEQSVLTVHLRRPVRQLPTSLSAYASFASSPNDPQTSRQPHQCGVRSCIAASMSDGQGPPQECTVCQQYFLRDEFGEGFDDDEPVCWYCRPQGSPDECGPDEGWWSQLDADPSSIWRQATARIQAVPFPSQNS